MKEYRSFHPPSVGLLQLLAAFLYPIFTGGLEIRYLPGGAVSPPPPTISAPSYPIFKMLMYICLSGPKERIYKISSRSGKKKIRLLWHFKENRHTRPLRMGLYNKKLRMVRTETFFFSKLSTKHETNKYNKKVRFLTLSLKMYFHRRCPLVK